MSHDEPADVVEEDAAARSLPARYGGCMICNASCKTVEWPIF
jgi:hypothetical protein